jgi:acyl-CoA synthetase (AMP-forming)/AMP-acid ligase II
MVLSLNPMFRAMELAPVLEKTTPTAVIVQSDLYPEMRKALDGYPVKTVIAARLVDFIPESPALPPPPGVMAQGEAFPETIDFMDLIFEGQPTPVCRIDDLDADLALLQLTGGTTGTPKAAMISMRAFSVAVIASMHWFNLTAEDINLGLAPFFHIMGLQITMVPALISGGKLLILTRFTPEITARAIAERKCTAWVAAPTMITALVNMPGIDTYDFSSLRVVVTGGSPISLSLQQRLREIAPMSELGEGYGMTETLAQGGVTTPLGRWKPGYTGIPAINDVKIVDLDTGLQEMPINQEGEIVIKGPTVMNGYWNQPEETAKSIRDGWLYTGDIGLLDEEGYLKIVDRKKELILCSGFNVYPSDVENILSRHPAILEVAVIGVPDEYRGESAKAFVILKSQFVGKVSEEDIIDWCRENMASYKRPRAVEFRETFPKSAAGKILKRSLHES